MAVAAAAAAHDPFEITTDARLHPKELDVNITMARSTAQKVCALDAGVLDGSSFENARPAIERCALGLYVIRGGAEPIQAREARASLTVENDVELKLVYPEPAQGPLRLEAQFFERLDDSTYGAVITVFSERTFLGQQLVNKEVPAFEVALPSRGEQDVPNAADGPKPEPASPSFAAYLKLGVEHILTGYDHLLFLAGLLAVCRRWRTMLGIVTCFTLAHSVTLVLAALDVFALPSRWVEPLIAASIVFVGVENLLRGAEPKGRWALTFAFGLVHGFGFAGVLRELGLGANGAPIVLPVFAFNLGVELGQAAVAAVALPLLWRLQRDAVTARRTTVVLSFVVAALGLYWLIDRTLLA